MDKKKTFYVVIDGTDGSGKETQSILLKDNLAHAYKSGINDIVKLSFPMYGNKSCDTVNRYLQGEYGEDATEVNPYVASVPYFIDRFESYKSLWGKVAADANIVIMDRYTVSNVVHQAAKLQGNIAKLKYVEWLYELEYKNGGLPEPDLIIVLDMPPEKAAELRTKRADKTGQSDIHESNRAFMDASYNNALHMADLLDWEVVKCVTEDGSIKTVDDIQKDILVVFFEKYNEWLDKK